MTLNSPLLAITNPLDHVVQHPLPGTENWSFSVTNHMLMIFLAGILMLIVILMAGKHRTIVPSGLRNFIEAICVFLRDDLARPILGESTDRFIPLIWNTFFFILFVNLLGMIPIDSVFFGTVHHLGGTATANIWVTGALAIMAFLVTHIAGIREQGLWCYVKNFIPPVPVALIPLMYVLEFAGALIKPVALSVRLFANMVAGHTILAALIGLAISSGTFVALGIPVGILTVVGCALFSVLELFVAFLQAYIFTFLMAIFIGAAMHPNH